MPVALRQAVASRGSDVAFWYFAAACFVAVAAYSKTASTSYDHAVTFHDHVIAFYASDAALSHYVMMTEAQKVMTTWQKEASDSSIEKADLDEATVVIFPAATAN